MFILVEGSIVNLNRFDSFEPTNPSWSKNYHISFVREGVEVYGVQFETEWDRDEAWERLVSLCIQGETDEG